MFESKFKIKYRETDAAGSQYFVNALNVAHDMLEHIFEKTGIGWNQWFKDPEWSAPIRHVEADYKESPL